VHGEDFDGPDASFDVVVSCECMEHNPAWAATTTNMVRVLKPGGLLLLTCAAPGRPEHGTPMTDPGSSPLTASKGQDHYRNLTPRDFHRVLRGTGLTSTASWVNWESNDLYLAGFKGEQPRGWPPFVAAVGEYRRAVRRPADLLRNASLAVGGQTGYVMGERLIGMAHRRVPRRRAEAIR
jgi:SAM-dependent methyltransferase